MNRPAAVLYAVLHEKTGAEIISGTEVMSASQLRFLVRVKPGQPTTRWLGVVEGLLSVSIKAKWGLDISKQYFLAPHLKFGWRIILQSSDLENHIALLAEAVKHTQVRGAPVQEEDIPLQGSPNRSPTAGLMGTVATGPGALRMG